MKLLYLTGALLVFCGAGACAQDTLTLLSPANTGGASAAGVYTSPYNIGVNSTSVATQLVCDDYLNDISVGETWQANVATFTTLTSSNVSSLLFGSSSTAPPSNPTYPNDAVFPTDIAADYAVAAVLTAELMSLSDLTSDAAKGYSFAIWNVFDKSLGDPTGLGLALPDLTAAENLVTAAMAQDAALGLSAGSVDLNLITVNGHSISGLTVYTPTADSPNNGGSSVPQEFLQVSMPEPSYPAVLALDLLAVAGLLVFFRRRRSGTIN